MTKKFLVVSGCYYLSRSASTGLTSRRAWTRDRSKAARHSAPVARAYASRFWGGGVVQA